MNYNITINSIDIPDSVIHRYTKDNTLSRGSIYTKSYDLNYYCRDDKCMVFEDSYYKPYIEFPDENENIKNYIFKTCMYDDNLKKVIKCSDIDKNSVGDYSNCCESTVEVGSYNVSVTCRNDSDCFSNKCIDSYCVFNDDSPVEHCDVVYQSFSIFENSYVNCGKGYDEPCTSDSECSSKGCGGKPKTCSSFLKRPSDSDASMRSMHSAICLVVIVFFIIPLLLSICIYIYHEKYMANSFEKI